MSFPPKKFLCENGQNKIRDIENIFHSCWGGGGKSNLEEGTVPLTSVCAKLQYTL